MAVNSPPMIPLVMGDDPEPNFNWFGNFDYSWFDNSGSLSSVPFFEAVPEQLHELVETSSARRRLRLGFSPGDCTTVSGSRNCTEACSDPSSLFTPTNLRVCTTLASAALLVQNDTYSIDRSDAQTLKAIDSWQIPELSTYNATGVLAHLVQCIPESCTVTKLGECTEDVQSLSGIEIEAGSLGAISSKLGHYCDRTNLEINSDIAGPGVLLSYFFQTGLALSLYLLLKASTTWGRRLDTLFGRRGEEDASQFRNKLTTLQSRLATSRLGAAVVSSMVEFQEVQIYFVASVQVATLISYNPETTETTGANNTSFAAVLLNSGLAALLNINSLSCILLAQCSLQRARMHWWYTFVMVTFAFILTVVIFARRNSLMPPAEGLWEKFKGDVLLPLCGDNPSPMTYCKPPRETKFLDNAVQGYAVCGLGALVWVGLLIDQLAFAVSKRFPVVAKSLSNPKHILQRKSKIWRSMSAAYWFTVEFLLLVLAVYNVVVLALILEGVDISDTASWSFGQYIAVMIWVPTIAKFTYFNVFGVKEGFEERIPNSYKISIKVDAEEIDEARPVSGRKSSHDANLPLREWRDDG